MFSKLKQQLIDNFKEMSKNGKLFYVNIDREIIWLAYLEGFEDEDEKQSHNCNCCKSFLRQYGGIVTIINNKMVSIWDGLDVDDIYKVPVDNLSKYIHSLPITDIFLSAESTCGTPVSYDSKRDVNWNHFALTVPNL